MRRGEYVFAASGGGGEFRAVPLEKPSPPGARKSGKILPPHQAVK